MTTPPTSFGRRFSSGLTILLEPKSSPPLKYATLVPNAAITARMAALQTSGCSVSQSSQEGLSSSFAALAQDSIKAQSRPSNSGVSIRRVVKARRSTSWLKCQSNSE